MIIKYIIFLIVGIVQFESLSNDIKFHYKQLLFLSFNSYSGLLVRVLISKIFSLGSFTKKVSCSYFVPLNLK